MKDSINALFKELEADEARLSPGQKDFVASLKRYYRKEGRLSEKQEEVLLGINKWKMPKTEKV